MKNLYKIIPFLTIIIFHQNTIAQNLSQDSEGFSNIIVPSTQLNLDISNKIATFDFINFYSKKSAKKVFYGLQLKGKSENGVGIIFSDEKIASNSSINFLLGHSWSSKLLNNKKTNQTSNTQIIDEIKKLSDTLDEIRKNHIKLVEAIPQINSTKNTLIQIIKNSSALKKDAFIKTSNLKKMVKTIKTLHEKEIFHYYRENSIHRPDDNGNSIKLLIDNASGYYNSVISSLNKLIALSEKLDIKLKELGVIENSNPKRFPINNLLFIRGGVNGSSFKYDENKGATTIAERFNNITF